MKTIHKIMLQDARRHAGLITLWLAALLLCFGLLTQAGGQPLPPEIVEVLPTNAPAFDTNGMNFTNVTYKVAAGTISFTASDGLYFYIQGDIDLWKVKALDVGFGGEFTQRSSQAGFRKAAAVLELIKNANNFQIVGKIGYAHDFGDEDDNTGQRGDYAEVGLDLNYNLTRGANLPFLGNSKSAFTYVGAGVSWATKKFDSTITQKDLEKTFRVYAGYAF